MPEAPDRILQKYQAYLECLTYIRVDPRLWRRFGWSDIVQVTLEEAYRDLKLLESLSEAERQRRLRRMLVNNLLERIEHERAKIRDHRQEVYLNDALSSSSSNLQNDLAVDAPSPAAHVESAERAAQLVEALSRLPERERQALLLQKYHGWTLAQIAEQLQCTIGAVAGLHARGLERLRRNLGTEAEE